MSQPGDPLLQTGKEEAEEGWSKKHPCDHFADDLRLSDLPGQWANGPANGQNNEHLQKEGDRKLGAGHDVQAEYRAVGSGNFRPARRTIAAGGDICRNQY
jgi:hypothetical protein